MAERIRSSSKKQGAVTQNAPVKRKKDSVWHASVNIAGDWGDAIQKSLMADPSKLPPRDVKPRAAKKKTASNKPKR